MKTPDTIYPLPGGRLNERLLWIRAFGVYLFIECLFTLFAYFVYRRYCVNCIQPFTYHLLRGLTDAVFTAGLWYSLYRLHRKSLYGNILINAIVFCLYACCWLLVIFLLEKSANFQETSARSDSGIIRMIVSRSWFDIGKYVLKLSAFYLLHYYIDYRKAEQQRLELGLINKDLQLHLMKQQLSPHFYFNTLNSLYGLARNNSQRLPQALRQLANIMQYVLHDCNHSRVTLRQEISFLQSYIALEKLRYEENTQIGMEVSGMVNGQSVLPLLLIQFVENAFKHGMKEKSENSWMKVKMEVNGSELLFSVDNSSYNSKPAEGIGLGSVKRRLDLLYEDRYDLILSQDEDRFSLQLRLQLS